MHKAQDSIEKGTKRRREREKRRGGKEIGRARETETLGKIIS